MLCVCNILRMLGAVGAGGEVIYSGYLRVPKVQSYINYSRNNTYIKKYLLYFRNY